MKDRRQRLLFFVLGQFLSTIVTVSAQSANESLSDLFPQLKDLERFPAPGTGYGSRQNLTYCCLQAVNHALKYSDGTLTYANQSEVTISGTPNEFGLSAASGQFPCTAAYVSGEYSGAPDVLVTHRYCEDTCGQGWARSPLATSGGWLQAIIGFIIPTIVFTLSIPRRYKIRIPNRLFDPDIYTWLGFFEGIGGFLVAASLGALDVLIWLSVCFACSGPMILSALHEAMLDKKVLQYLKETKETNQITTDMRARMLFIVLIGNLDINLRPEGDSVANDQSQYLADDSPFYHIERLIYPLRIYNSEHGRGYHPSQWRLREDSSAYVPNESHPPNGNAIPPSSPVDTPPVADKSAYGRRVDEAKCRLHAMLECQYSFGATVGSPVAFFIAAFLYTLVNTLAGLGDETHSLSLAFGFWWMTVPHIAIVSGLLLAGNNPNTLEGVVARPGSRHKKDDFIAPFELGNIPFTKIPIKFPVLKHSPFQPAYQSSYKIAWLWQRGINKQRHIDMISTIYLQTTGDIPQESQPDEADVARLSTEDRSKSKPYDRLILKFQQQTRLTKHDWLTIYAAVGILIGVPFGLAFMTAYTTPTVGLACRSFTFLVYTITQILQIILLALTNHYRASAPTSVIYLWKMCSYVFRAAAIFVSIGGTMMQLMGTYNECKCNVSMWYWRNLDNPKVWIEISTNSAQDIYYAKKYWQGAAITAILFLASLCLFGWWYQRRLRNLFHDIADDLDKYTRKAVPPSTVVHTSVPAATYQTATPASSTGRLLPASHEDQHSFAPSRTTYMVEHEEDE